MRKFWKSRMKLLEIILLLVICYLVVPEIFLLADLIFEYEVKIYEVKERIIYLQEKEIESLQEESSYQFGRF